MGIKSFLKKVNEVADSNKSVKFDSSLSGVHVYNRNKVCLGYRLFDGNLIDIDGRILKKFNYKYLGLIYDKFYLAQKAYEEKSWGMFDLNGKPIWKKKFANHHDILLSSQKTVFTFNREVKEYKGRKVEFDIIEEYSFKGVKINSYSIFDHLKEFQTFHSKLTLDFPKLKFLPEVLKSKQNSPWGGNFDYYRLNSMQIIPKNKLGLKDKRFQEGNWVLSFRHGSMIFILDKETQEIVWSLTQKDVKNEIQGQHGVQMLQSGNLLIFDNGRYRGWSRIIELNPINLEINFEYKEKDFFTASQGYVQKLKNGNYLITESEKGRVFEITSDKEIVWEYYHNETQSEKNSKYLKSFGTRQWIYRAVHYDEIKNL